MTWTTYFTVLCGTQHNETDVQRAIGTQKKAPNLNKGRGGGVFQEIKYSLNYIKNSSKSELAGKRISKTN